MRLDAQLQFSDSQALTATGASTNNVDLSSDRNIGIGEELSVLVVAMVAPDAGDGNETYTVTVQTDDNPSFTSPATVAPAVTITRGEAAGTRHVIPIPADTLTERYLRLYFTLGGTTPALTVSAWLTPTKNIDAVPTYARGYNVS